MSQPNQPNRKLMNPGMNSDLKPGTTRIPASTGDELSDRDLAVLINAAFQKKTGRAGSIAPTAPPPGKRHVDLTHILGDLDGPPAR